jgi:putative sterol carrier protein
MAAIFSDAWMKELMNAWNNEPEVKDKLAEIGFNSVITCGFKDEENPRGVFVVENGVCVRAGDWNGEKPDWDMRADMKDWLKWVEKGIGMMGLGTAYATGKLKFKHGDYKAMIKDPRMAGPFVRSFGLMQQIGADELG